MGFKKTLNDIKVKDVVDLTQSEQLFRGFNTKIQNKKGTKKCQHPNNHKKQFRHLKITTELCQQQLSANIF